MPIATAVPDPSGGDDWVSTQEASEVLGISTRELYRLYDVGALTAARMGNRLVFRRREVLANRGAFDPWRIDW